MRKLGKRVHLSARSRQRDIVVAAVATLGLLTLHFTHAASLTSSSQAENGVVAGNASSVSDSNASGGSAIKFGTGSGGTNPLSSLPLIPWEGGPAYWDQFPIAKAAGWDNPNFFPLLIFFNGVSSDAEVQADESYGINTYVGMDPSADYNLFARNGAFILSPLNNTPANGTAAPGDFLDDEPDGRSGSLSTDLANVKAEIASSGNDGRFKEFNFTQIMVGDYGTSNNNIVGQMIDSYAGPASVDNYFYTMPDCTGSPSFNYSLIPLDAAHCRTASSYGTVVKELRQRNVAGGGPLKPLWSFVEDLTGAPDSTNFYADITPGQLEGAVMNSIINEARGILYFNGALGGTCSNGAAGNELRSVQLGNLPCAAPQMNAMKEVDGVVKNLAPVVNTQSYQYTFGTNLNTMLKWYNGSAYIFAMVSGDASSQPGPRTFTLPSGLTSASNITVVNENRTLPVSGGKFTDNFAAEYSYHIYKVTP